MKMNAQIAGLLFVLICQNANVIAQNKEWKTEKSKDGKISVKSSISKRTDEQKDEVQLIEYIASTTAKVAYTNCLSVLKDVSKHKDVIDEKETRLIKTISSTEWIIYYFFDAPWPLSDNDCVSTMIHSEDVAKKTSTFTITAAPDLLKREDVGRLTYYNLTYMFKDLGNGQVEMSVSAKISPTMQVPDWMVRSFFPEGPADMLRKLTHLAKGSL